MGSRLEIEIGNSHGKLVGVVDRGVSTVRFVSEREEEEEKEEEEEEEDEDEPSDWYLEGRKPVLPQGRGRKPRSRTRLSSLKGMPMSNPVLAAARRSRRACCMIYWRGNPEKRIR